MKTQIKKLISVFACVCLLLTAIIIPVSAETTATITFDADKANRTEYSTSIQVWEQNGVKVTNNKGASTSNVGDYAAPARFYKSSEVIVEYPGMTKLVIEAVSNYAAWDTSFTDANATATVDGTTITITFATAVDSFTFASMSAQSRANSMTVYAGEAGGETPSEPDEPVEPEEPATGSATITFDADKANRTEYSTSIQVWEQNGIKVTNNKGASTSNVGDYAAPARFYKSSEVIVEYPGMTKLVIEAVSNYAAWDTSFTDANATATVDGTTITITFATAVDSFTFASMSAQSRANSMTVYAGEAGDGTTEPVDPPVEEPEELPTPDETNTFTVEQAIECGALQQNNAYTEEKYYVTGTITAVANTTYGNVYISDDAGNQIYVYGLYNADGTVRYDGMEAKPDEGDTVLLYSVIGNYNGTPQLKDAWIIEFTAGDLEVEDTDPEADTELTIEEANTLGASKQSNIYTQGKYYVTGVITEVYNTQYGNMYIADDAGNTLNVYGTYSADGSARYDAMETKPVAGDTVKVYGVLGQYNGTAQMKDGWIVEHTPGEGSGETPDPDVPTDPDVPAETVDGIVLTVDSLGLASQSYSAATATIDGVGFEWIQLGNYGNGIQVRDKNDNTSSFWNTTAFSAPIKEIKLVYSSTKDVTYANADAEIFSFGNEAGAYTYSTKLSTEAGVKEYTITPDAETYTYLHFEHDLGYTMYWDSITIVLAEEQGGETPDPDVPSEPVDPDAPAFYIEDVTAAAGETVEVKVAIKNNPGFISAKLAINYDSNVLELVDKVAGENFGGMAFSQTLDANPYIVNWVDSINPDNTTNNVFVTLTFKVKEGVADGDYDITITYDPEDVYNANFDNVEFATEAGTVSVVSFVRGDLDDDGKINNRDLGKLMQYLNNWGVEINVSAADANGDGSVNNKDYGLLMQYLNRWDVELA